MYHIVHNRITVLGTKHVKMEMDLVLVATISVSTVKLLKVPLDSIENEMSLTR